MHRQLRGELGLPPLPEYLAPGLEVAFIGFNPGERSAQTGHYYAYPGNRFWWLLWQSGLTDRLLRPEEDHTLPALGYGLSRWEMRAGRERLLERLRSLKPRIACYNGKGVYTAASGRKTPAYGVQEMSLVAGVVDFVAASPSGRSRELLAVKLDVYRALSELVARPAGGHDD
jgi:double-stranded uracil-DNA glycosylase